MDMNRPRLYLETSVWNFFLADDAPEKKKVTQELFVEIENGKYSIFISEIVENEIQNAFAEKRKRLVDIIEKYRPQSFEDTVESRRLVMRYIENGLLSEDHIADLLHIASATVNEIDILVSWNMKHLVKLKTRTITNAVNKLLGYRDIEICTPEEVIENED